MPLAPTVHVAVPAAAVSGSRRSSVPQAPANAVCMHPAAKAPVSLSCRLLQRLHAAVTGQFARHSSLLPPHLYLLNGIELVSFRHCRAA